MTVDKMIQALSKIPGDTPVAYAHEFGTMNIRNLRINDDQILHKIDYGGDWQDADLHSDGNPDAPRYKVVVIGE